MRLCCLITACLILKPVCREVSSLYQIDLTKKGLYYAAFALPMGVAILVTEEKGFTDAELDALDKRDVNWLDRSAIQYFDQSFIQEFDYINHFLLWSPLALFLEKGARQDWLPLALMYLEFRLLEKSLAGTSKILVQRARPYTYNKTGKVSRNLQKSKRARRSFVSGHSVTGFGSAVYGSILFSDYFPDSPVRPYVWAGSLTLALVTAISRYYSGYHFPTDIAAGAALGAFIGWAIPELNRRPNQVEIKGSAVHSRSPGILLTYTF